MKFGAWACRGQVHFSSSQVGEGSSLRGGRHIDLPGHGRAATQNVVCVRSRWSVNNRSEISNQTVGHEWLLTKTAPQPEQTRGLVGQAWRWQANSHTVHSWMHCVICWLLHAEYNSVVKQFLVMSVVVTSMRVTVGKVVMEQLLQ